MGNFQTSTDKDMQRDCLRVSVFSDLHFHRDPQHRVPFPGSNYNIQQRARKILERLAEEQPELAICAGDLVDVGSAESYPQLDSVFEDLSLSTRLAFTPGNHDRSSNLFADIGMIEPSERGQILGRQNYTIVRGVHHLIFLDSSPHKNVLGASGEVGEEGREWLKGTLQGMPEGHVAWIVTHYPTIPFSDLLPERARMVDGTEVHDLLKQFSSRIGAVIYGHIHHRHQHDAGEIAYLCMTPSSVPLICRIPGRGEFDEKGALGFENLVLYPDKTFERTTKEIDVRDTVCDTPSR